MKKYLLLLTAICLIASLAACNNNSTSEQIISDLSSEQQATTEPTNTPEVTPTQEAEPTETPTEIEIPDGELPDGYSYNEETKILTYLYYFSGEMHEINYPGVDRAGTDENGNVAFYSEETNQEVWFMDGLKIMVIDHSGDIIRFLPGFALINKPIFSVSEKELELAYYSFVERDVAAMNEGIKGNYSQELKNFIDEKCISMISPTYVDHVFNEIEYLEDLFNGIAKKAELYPSEENLNLYHGSTIIKDEQMELYKFLLNNNLLNKYSDGEMGTSSMGVTCNYLFNKNKSGENYFEYYNNSVDALMEFGSSPSTEIYNEYVKSVFGENIPVEIAVINGLYYRDFLTNSNLTGATGNINGKQVEFLKVANDISRIYQEIYENYRNESSNLGDIMIQDYMKQLGLEIPELATIDDE